MVLKAQVNRRSYAFSSVREVMAKANEEKTGDRLAGIAAESAEERVAAKYVLSEMTLADLRNSPAVPYEEDEVTRIIQDDVDEEVYAEIRGWTVAELREWLLDTRTTTELIRRVSRGLTSEMIAAVCKLMDNMDLIYAAKKMPVTATCRTTIGMPGTFSSRLQPNHTTDDPRGILASVMEGLSLGCGDAVIGLNPVKDDVDSVARILDMFASFRDRWEVPTQVCVLSHVTTGMEAVRRLDAPADLLFQSVAGSQKGNEAFGIRASMLEDGRQLMLEKAAARMTPGSDNSPAAAGMSQSGSGNGMTTARVQHSDGNGSASEKLLHPGSRNPAVEEMQPNVMYFETGQGSELSSNAHNGWDQVTMEARCYGFARHFSPFLVNTVVGFIGPEYLYDAKQVIRAGLEDHFMGKLTGVPMGCDACYTNHMKADQNDNENLAMLLASAGCNYIMGVPQGDDCMLMYETTGYHDAAAIREILGLRPTAPFDRWLEKMGFSENGRLTPLAGDASVFLGRTPLSDAFAVQMRQQEASAVENRFEQQADRKAEAAGASASATAACGAEGLKTENQPESAEIAEMAEMPAPVDGVLPDLSAIDIRGQYLVEHPVDGKDFAREKKYAPCRLGIGKAGARYKTLPYLEFRAAHSAAQDAVFSDIDEEFVREQGLFIVKTQCDSRETFITRPDLGRKLSPDGVQMIRDRCRPHPTVEIYVADGLSFASVTANIPDLLPALLQGLESRHIDTGTPFFVHYGRVAVEDEVSEILGAEVVCTLIGERPGLLTAESMSAYIAWHAHVGMEETRWTVVSNIHAQGTNPVEAGAYIAGLIAEILEKKASGTELREL